MLNLFSRQFILSFNKTLAFGTHSMRKAKVVLTQEQNGVLNAAAALMVLVLITKFTGLIFNSISVGFLGAEPYNEFVFASNIPEIISASILFGAISASIIPALIESKEKQGHEGFLRVLNTLINTSLIGFAFFAAILALTAGKIMPWMIEEVIRPIEPVGEQEMQRIVLMMRLLLIPQIILGISTFVSSSLNVMQRFIVPQLAPLFYNFGRIFAVIVFIPILGKSPWVLVAGTFVGSLFHLLIQLPLAKHLNIRYQPVMAIKDKAFYQIVQLGLPRILGLSAEQIALGVDRVIAFGLIGNSLTAYELAIRLIVIPISLFGMTFATAIFPIMSRAYIQNDMATFSKLFNSVLNQIFFLSLPVTVLLIVLRLPITRLFYGIFGNNFSWDDTRMVAWVVMFFAVGLAFEALRSFIYRTYYALHNSITPLIAAVFVVIGGVITGLLFTNYFSHFDTFSIGELTFNPDYFFEKQSGRAGVGGLALSGSLVYTLESGFLIFYLNKKYLKIKPMELLSPLLVKTFITFLTGVLAYFLYTFYNDFLDTSKTSRIFFLTSTTVLASLLFYIGLSYQFRVKEVELVEKLMKKFFSIIKRKR